MKTMASSENSPPTCLIYRMKSFHVETPTELQYATYILCCGFKTLLQNYKTEETSYTIMNNCIACAGDAL